MRWSPQRFGAVLAALPYFLWAAARVTWLERRLELAVLTERLRRVRRFSWVSATLPGDLLALLDWLLPRLPDRSLGPCYRRSLVLLDLWSRCGLEPQLHLGARPTVGGGLEAHAWVTTAAGTGHEGVFTSSLGYSEILVFPPPPAIRAVTEGSR
jgi:hypothetical protein